MSDDMTDDDMSDAEFDAMCIAHEAYAENHGITIYNHGWFADDDCYMSKTDKGILVTYFDDLTTELRD